MKPLLISLVLAIAVCACGQTMQRLPESAPSPADTYREKARILEQQAERQKALLTWHIVRRLEPDNPETAKSIKKLETAIDEAARKHFQQGLNHFKAGRYDKARRAFLIVVRNKPNHREALNYLKTNLENVGQTTYTIQAGDNYTRIAAKIYKDPGKAYVIAHFNDLHPDKPLMIGQKLRLPSISQGYLMQPSDIATWLDQAKKAYENQRYDEALSLTRKIQDQDPGQTAARRLADHARFDKGMDLFKQQRYLEAEAELKQVSPGFRGRNQALGKVRSQIKQLGLEEKLSLAQQHLRNNAWERVLEATEEILKQDPDNIQANMLFSNASYNQAKVFLESGQVAKAMKLLERIDPSYEDTGQLLSVARARMRSQADTHYRDGVKHFVNEDLESAIKLWKRALELNPEHPKARQDIEKAQRLLRRLKALE